MLGWQANVEGARPGSVKKRKDVLRWDECCQEPVPQLCVSGEVEVPKWVMRGIVSLCVRLRPNPVFRL